MLSAAKNNHLNIVKFFVIKGADIAVHDNEGNNIFMIAAKNGYLKIIDYIAHEKEIDLSTIKDKNNNTLLHLAVLHYHDLDNSNDLLKLIKYLFYFRKLDLEEKNDDGNTPLDLAMEMEDNNLVENLLQLGAKIDPAKPRSNVHVHQIHQDKPEELGRYVLKQNEDLLANSTLPEAYPKQKKVKRSKKKARHFSKLQQTPVKDAFDMQGLNDSLNPLVSATGFFQNHLQAPQSLVSPFNLSSISVGSMGMNHSNASQALSLVPALFNIPRKNHSINISQIERREQEDRMVESINNYEFNTTVKPF
ncbi:ankyrin repeat domain-containing protein [Rickettsiella endosymbiont of Rhagonycha lignosa]|uniref:ankyrin repeat domain-containing protein n=1 Tax=Rickettsiella endosymbiont of Rhagonycha lignosa TaxID=3077937 RepID=UPI00313D791B